MEGVDRRVEHAAASIPPSRGVKRDGQLAIAFAVQRRDAGYELSDRAAGVHPRADNPIDGLAQAATALSQERHEQLVPAAEVVTDSRVCHAYEIRDGAYLNSAGAATDEQLLSRVEDQAP
jgi:hypothetical protein